MDEEEGQDNSIPLQSITNRKRKYATTSSSSSTSEPSDVEEGQIRGSDTEESEGDERAVRTTGETKKEHNKNTKGRDEEIGEEEVEIDEEKGETSDTNSDNKEGESETKERRGIKGWAKKLLLDPVLRYLRLLVPDPETYDYGLEWNPYKYLKKWGGVTFRGSPPVPPSFVIVFFHWAASFLGIWLVGILHFEYFTASEDIILLIGSFGASAVLIYAAPQSPLAQPRNFLGGHLVSSIVGLLCHDYFPAQPLKATPCAAAVSIAIAAMQLTGTLHPPGAATALIAALGGPGVDKTGWLLVPLIQLGAFIMLLVALAINNIPKAQRYPAYWW